jgi:8-oxo-dGTP diphosphatase
MYSNYMEKLKFFTVNQISKALNVNYRTILREIERGNLSAHKIGRVFIIDETQFLNYKNKTIALQPLKICTAIVIKNDTTLVVKRRIKEGLLRWQFPSGTLKHQELSSFRAEKECHEETGISCKATRFLGKRIHPDTKAIIMYWQCQYLTGTPHNNDPHENEAVTWVKKKKALDLFTSNVFKPVKKLLED